MIPLMLDLRGRRVLIFGGGRVSLRKARFFSDEADVAVVSRSFSEDLATLGIECIPMDLSAATDEALLGLMEGAFLVVAATDDPDLNNRIGRLCSLRGILFNNADGETGDVLVPSVVRGEHYCISISTCGRSPAIARYLRISLAREHPQLDRMVLLQEDLRRDLKETEPSGERRSEVLWQVLEDREVWEALSHGMGEARTLVTRRYLHG